MSICAGSRFPLRFVCRLARWLFPFLEGLSWEGVSSVCVWPEPFSLRTPGSHRVQGGAGGLAARIVAQAAAGPGVIG
jgi:hypothetical protein